MHQGSRRPRPHFCPAVRGEIRISGADPALSGKPIPPLALSTRRNLRLCWHSTPAPAGAFSSLARTRVSVTVSWNQAALSPGKNPSWVSICSSFVVSGVGSSSRACPELLERPGQQADLAHETVPTASSPTLRDDVARSMGRTVNSLRSSNKSLSIGDSIREIKPRAAERRCVRRARRLGKAG